MHIHKEFTFHTSLYFYKQKKRTKKLNTKYQRKNKETRMQLIFKSAKRSFTSVLIREKKRMEIDRYFFSSHSLSYIHNTVYVNIVHIPHIVEL